MSPDLPISSARSLQSGAHGDSIPVVLNIDVEPDGTDFDPFDDVTWDGFECASSWLGDQRKLLEDWFERPVRFVWLVRCDPQIAMTYGYPGWAFDRYEGTLAALAESGDEIGIHVHTFRWSASRDRWIQDFADNDWACDCLASGVDAFHQALGRPPYTVSIGNNFLNTTLANKSRELGVRYDLTCVAQRAPMPIGPKHGLTIGRLSDHSGVPQYPYHPHPRNYQSPSDRIHGYHVVPITSVVTHGIRRAPDAPRSDRIHLRLGSGAMSDALDELKGRDQRHVVLSVRSSVFASAGQRRGIADGLAFLASHRDVRIGSCEDLVTTLGLHRKTER